MVSDHMKGENTTMENFSSRSNHRQVGDIIPVSLIEPTSIEKDRISKAKALLEEALELLEREK